MKTRKHIRKIGIRQAGFLMLILMLAISIPLIEKQREKIIFSQERIQRVLDKNVDALTHRLEIISQGEEMDGRLGEMLFHRKGKAYFRFEHDSLCWWSTDAVPPPDVRSLKPGENKIHFIANAHYLVIQKEKENNRWLGLYLIFHDFPYQNPHLPQGFNRDFRLPPSAKIHFETGDLDVLNRKGDFCFSVIKPENNIHSIPQIIPFFLWILAYILLLRLLYIAYLLLATFGYRQWIIILGFAIDALILRVLLLYFRFPESLHTLEVFQPNFFASSSICPSLGDLLWNAITLFAIAWVAYRHLPRIRTKKIHTGWKGIFLHGFIQLPLLYAFWRLGDTYASLVLNSSIPFDLNGLLYLNEYSLLGLLVLLLLILAWFLAAYRLTGFALRLHPNINAYFLTAIVLIPQAIFFTSEIQSRLIISLFILLMLTFYIQHSRFKSHLLPGISLIFILIFSAHLSLVLESSLQEREREKRILMAARLIEQRDQLGEYLFKETREKILKDTLLNEVISQALEEGNDALVQDYLTQTHLQGYFQRYNLTLTVCRTDRLLDVQPGNYIVDCQSYFEGLVKALGKQTVADSLYFIDLGGDHSNYLAVLKKQSQGQEIHLFLEFYLKHIPQGLGYPELLINEAWMPEGLPNYSYAIYRDGELIRRVGRYFYNLSPEEYLLNHPEGGFFSGNLYDHYLKIVDDSLQLMLSRPQKLHLDAIAPFSYLLVFGALCLTIFYLLRSGRKRGKHTALTLRWRLQLAMVAVILMVFLTVGAASLWFLVKTNQNKNQDILSEKAHSVLVELEHKLADRDELNSGMQPYMEELLRKFSQVFFSDINLYGTDGWLLASSRPEIFVEGLTGEQMNADAWEKLYTEGQSLVLLQEQIGYYPYLSAYIPFRNNRNELLGYVNLPYFARQAELREEISGFMVAIINIYVVLIALTLMAALFISTLFTSPLKLIREKIRQVRLGTANDKIDWPRHDEIGALVMEYNRMVDALAESAQALARTEREMAWREMARQVAHEIKNPLTPMKLSVQYLEKAWKDKAPDWDARLTRFTATLTEQIDTLSEIATAFSDFARMPENENAFTSLSQIARNAIDTFREGNAVQIQEIWDPEKEFIVYADKKQLLRVFNNLIKNALQALGKKKDGQVLVEIRSQGDRFLVSIADNGPGIADAQREKIFMPNFTTKSGGMGLGLAMAHNIITSLGGRIWYETEAGKGSIFHFSLPAADK
jgi:signal transduction histidine kinase